MWKLEKKKNNNRIKNKIINKARIFFKCKRENTIRMDIDDIIITLLNIIKKCVNYLTTIHANVK